jgi:putative Mn2+ efflux pump MntP
MVFFVLVLLGFGLSFDTFAVSVSCGLIDIKIKFWQAVRIALFFAFFQAFMPVIGYFLGYYIREYTEKIDHWLAFILLALLGIKMIGESFKPVEKRSFNPHRIKIILGLSLATSIDAFVVGVSLALVNVNLFLAFFVISSVTFITAMLGMLSGKKIGNYFGRKVEILGGLILILIGINILVGHVA